MKENKVNENCCQKIIDAVPNLMDNKENNNNILLEVPGSAQTYLKIMKWSFSAYYRFPPHPFDIEA